MDWHAGKVVRLAGSATHTWADPARGPHTRAHPGTYVPPGHRYVNGSSAALLWPSYI